MSVPSLHLPRLRKPILTRGDVRCLILWATLAADTFVVWLLARVLSGA